MCFCSKLSGENTLICNKWLKVVIETVDSCISDVNLNNKSL